MSKNCDETIRLQSENRQERIQEVRKGVRKERERERERGPKKSFLKKRNGPIEEAELRVRS